MHKAGHLAPHSPFSRLMELVAESCGATVNLHDVADVTVLVPDLQLKPEQHVHHGSFCRFAKFTDNNKRCARNKQRSIDLTRSRDGAFWGCCPFGVWDLAQPLKHEGCLLAVLYLGHFRGKLELQPVRGKPYAGPPLPPVTASKIRELKKAALLLESNFLLIMDDWSQKHGAPAFSRDRSYYGRAAMRFIEARYSENINLQDLAAELGVHPHYLGKTIAAACGQNFKSLLQRRRIDEARLLLCSTEDSVTDIAFAAGFQDSNYFSTVFRGLEGMSPTAYRRKKMTEPPGRSDAS